MKTTAVIEKDTEGFGVFTPDLKTTIVGEGRSVEEAKADFLNTYKELLSYYTESGDAVPEELKDLEFEYKYDISSVFNEFDFINISKFAKWTGIEPSLLRHYKLGDTYISAAQAKKIEKGLHRAARRMMQVLL